MDKANINAGVIMTIENILQRGQAGEKLNAEELAALMSHAIYLLKYIENCTQKSISHAHDILAEQYQKAA